MLKKIIRCSDIYVWFEATGSVASRFLSLFSAAGIEVSCNRGVLRFFKAMVSKQLKP